MGRKRSKGSRDSKEGRLTRPGKAGLPAPQQAALAFPPLCWHAARWRPWQGLVFPAAPLAAPVRGRRRARPPAALPAPLRPPRAPRFRSSRRAGWTFGTRWRRGQSARGGPAGSPAPARRPSAGCTDTSAGGAGGGRFGSAHGAMPPPCCSPTTADHSGHSQLLLTSSGSGQPRCRPSRRAAAWRFRRSLHSGECRAHQRLLGPSSGLALGPALMQALTPSQHARQQPQHHTGGSALGSGRRRGLPDMPPSKRSCTGGKMASASHVSSPDTQLPTSCDMRAGRGPGEHGGMRGPCPSSRAAAAALPASLTPARLAPARPAVPGHRGILPNCFAVRQHTDGMPPGAAAGGAEAAGGY